MKQSIKIDIIYFRVERDTKMEFHFNDSGDVPVRTLASSVNDRDEFLYALKRGVYRSDTVIVVGGLSASIYVPGIIGAAIGAPAEKVDYNALGFAEPARPLAFPKGSIPLVTQDNHIGGMLLEKGRQSIIVLSEDIDIRHRLLDDLIYPYIFDMGMDESYDAPSQPVVSEPVSEAEEPVLAEPAEVSMPEEEIVSEPAVEEISEEIVEEAVAEEAEESAETAEEAVEEDTLVEEVPEVIEGAATEEITVEEIKAEEEPANEEPAVMPLPHVSDGMFVIADDGSDDEDPEEEEDSIPLMGYSSNAMDNAFNPAVFVDYEDEDNGDYYNNDEHYAPKIPVAKVLGIIVALLCIGASAALFTIIVMNLL